MKIIKHRVNTLEQLSKLEPALGAEIDLRSRGDDVILAHDPFCEGDRLESYVELWSRKERGTLILNPKEDGLEARALAILKRYDISDFVFLDLAMPTAIKMVRDLKFRKIAVRISEFEPLAGVRSFEGEVDWAWLDSFSGRPADSALAAELAKRFKVCLVSPELQGYPQERIPSFHGLAPYLSAVCTKYPECWSLPPS